MEALTWMGIWLGFYCFFVGLPIAIVGYFQLNENSAFFIFPIGISLTQLMVVTLRKKQLASKEVKP